MFKRAMPLLDGVRIYRMFARLFNDTPSVPKPGRSLTVLDALDMYWSGHLAHKAYARCAKYHLYGVAKRLGGYELAKISRAEIEAYKRERSKDIRRNDPKGTRTISARTVQMELQYLNMALNFAVDSGALSANPIKRFIHVPQGRPKKVVFDDGYENGPQWASVYGALNERIKPVALTLYETGMRPKECFNMRWNWLKEKGRDRWVITVPGYVDKTGSEHDIPVSARLLELFRSMGLRSQDGGALVFPAQRNLTRSRSNIDVAFQNALARAGLAGQNITPYALRRTRLTIWDAIDPGACRYVAGHVAREVHLKHYVRISHERLFKLVGLEFKPSFNRV